MQATLFSGYKRLEVKGESFYQDNLRRVVAELGREVPAVLVPEPDNEYDGNAVEVWVGGLKVGYLSREEAAVYQPAIAQLARQTGRPVAVDGRIFGGEPDKPSFGIWLYHEPADFGLAVQRRERAIGTDPGIGIFTGASRASLGWMESLPTDRLAAIKELRRRLERETDLLSRHFAFNLLEEYLYASREVFVSALAEFEEVCERHHSEMRLIRPALIAEFGGLPMLPTYRQMAIMKRKAQAYRDALIWAERGLTVYGRECLREDAIDDLRKRCSQLRVKLGEPSRGSAPFQ